MLSKDKIIVEIQIPAGTNSVNVTEHTTGNMSSKDDKTNFAEDTKVNILFCFFIIIWQVTIFKNGSSAINITKTFVF